MRSAIDKHTGPEGHRERLRQRFKKSGRNAMADYELLELLLTYVIPRIDTKPIAKALLHRFGSLLDVLQQPYDHLAQVKGTVLDREDFDRGAFAAHGGFNRLNKIFQGNFQLVLDEITATLYPDQRETA